MRLPFNQLQPSQPQSFGDTAAPYTSSSTTLTGVSPYLEGLAQNISSNS